MDATEKPATSGAPPYLAFSRFETFVSSFKGKTLPARFDRSLMRSISGADQSQLRIALRFLSLVNGEDRFTPSMQQLVGAYGTGDAWKQALRSTVQAAYSSIVGDLDKTASQGQLTEAFRMRGKLGGSALEKAIRFYLAAARGSDTELSPYFTTPTVASGSNNDATKRTTPRRSRRPREPRDTMDPSAESGSTDGTKKLRYTLPSGEIQVSLPEGITPKELDALAKYLREYVELSRDETV